MVTRKIQTHSYTDDRGYEKTQYSVTVPKKIAEEYDMKGAKLDWEESENADTLQVTVVRDE